MVEGVRQFPCTECGAKVEFAPGTDALQCPYCGNQTEISTSKEAIEEQDYVEAAAADLGEGAETEEVSSVRCESCAALVEPSASAEAFPCPYCGSSIVATPDALKKLASLDGRLQGLYAPYWTYDSDTVSRYTGQRGDNYTVTRTRTVTRDGKSVTETYQDTEIRWRPARGTVSRNFDDMLVVGSASLPRDLPEALEPWDLGNLVGYADHYLSGFLAERYQVDVRKGWVRAQERMEVVIRRDVERDIGGDHQRIHELDTDHRDITFKHILLPMWVCSYRYREKIYRFLVNARTGEVQGQRPWSWIKILATAITAAAVIYMLYTYFNQ